MSFESIAKVVQDLGPYTPELAAKLGLPPATLRVVSAATRCFAAGAGKFMLSQNLVDLRDIARWPIGTVVVKQSSRQFRWAAPLRPVGLLRTAELAAGLLSAPIETAAEARAEFAFGAQHWLMITRLPGAARVRLEVFQHAASLRGGTIRASAKLSPNFAPDALPQLLARIPDELRTKVDQTASIAGAVAGSLDLQLPDPEAAARQFEAALQHQLRVGLVAAAQTARDTVSLLDATFDLDASSYCIFKEALQGNWNRLLQQTSPGVTVTSCLLSEQLKKQQSIQLSMPWRSKAQNSQTKITTLQAGLERNGAHLFFQELDAESDCTQMQKNLRQTSRLTLHLFRGVLAGQPLPAEAQGRYTLSGITNATLLETLRKTYGAAMQELPEEDGVTVTVALPGWLATAWRDAPKDRKHPGYLAASCRLQRTLRAIVPALALGKGGALDPALRVWTAMPVTTDIRRSGNNLLLNQTSGLYWDWMNPVLLQSLAAASGQTAQVQQEAVSGNYRNQLRSLLYTEATLIERATKAGRKLAEARDAEDRTKQIQEAIAYLMDTFHRTLGSLYGDLRPFAPLLLAAAAPFED